MVKIYNRLEIKLTASFLVLILVVSGMLFFFTYKNTKQALKETVQEELLAIAQVTASQIDGDVFAKIKKGDSKKTGFLSIRDRLHNAQKSNPDIKFIYSYRANDDKSVKFIVDAEYGISDDAADIEELYTDITPQMMEGLTKAAVENEFSTDKWGTFMSGYAPIKDSKGRIVGAVGVDMLSTKVMEKQKFIGKTLIFIFLIALIIAGLIIELFSRTIIRDVNKLNTLANKISTGDMDTQMDIKKNDEIGELAESFGRMIASLKIMMMDDDKKK